MVFLLVGGRLVFWGRCFGGSMGRKVAYVLRVRYVVFATLRNQLIFYGKTCWFRSVVTPTSRKRNMYTTFACWVEASSGLGGHFSMDFSLKRLCKIGIFAILRSPRCATSTFFDKKMSWLCSAVNSTCRKRYTYATFVMSWKEASLGLLEASLEATWVDSVFWLK